MQICERISFMNKCLKGCFHGFVGDFLEENNMFFGFLDDLKIFKRLVLGNTSTNMKNMLSMISDNVKKRSCWSSATCRMFMHQMDLKQK